MDNFRSGSRDEADVHNEYREVKPHVVAQKKGPKETSLLITVQQRMQRFIETLRKELGVEDEVKMNQTEDRDPINTIVRLAERGKRIFIDQQLQAQKSGEKIIDERSTVTALIDIDERNIVKALIDIVLNPLEARLLPLVVAAHESREALKHQIKEAGMTFLNAGQSGIKNAYAALVDLRKSLEVTIAPIPSATSSTTPSIETRRQQREAEAARDEKILLERNRLGGRAA